MIDKKSAAAALRDFADKLTDASYTWADSDIVGLGTIVRQLNEFQFGEAAKEGGKIMSRAAFDSLSPELQMKFVKGGGKLIDA